MSMAINLKKETACVLKPANILKLHSAYTIFRSNIVSCNEKFYTIFMNFKTKFKIFSLKSPPSQKNKANIELKFFPWIRCPIENAPLSFRQNLDRIHIAHDRLGNDLIAHFSEVIFHISGHAKLFNP